MNIDEIKKYFNYLMIAGGLFIIVILIYTTFLISRYAQKKQTIKKSYAEEEINPPPSLTPIQRIKIE